MEKTIKYCSYSDTIRQFPENYMLCTKNGRGWLFDFDLASDKKILHLVLDELSTYEGKYMDGDQLASILNDKLNNCLK